MLDTVVSKYYSCTQPSCVARENAAKPSYKNKPESYSSSGSLCVHNSTLSSTHNIWDSHCLKLALRISTINHRHWRTTKLWSPLLRVTAKSPNGYLRPVGLLGPVHPDFPNHAYRHPYLLHFSFNLYHQPYPSHLHVPPPNVPSSRFHFYGYISACFVTFFDSGTLHCIPRITTDTSISTPITYHLLNPCKIPTFSTKHVPMLHLNYRNPLHLLKIYSIPPLVPSRHPPTAYQVCIRFQLSTCCVLIHYQTAMSLQSSPPQVLRLQLKSFRSLLHCSPMSRTSF